MQTTPFTPRNAAKFVVRGVVYIKTAQITKHAIVDRTRFESDDMIVQISGNLVGWYVADKVKPYTDKMVDVAADKIAERRAKKKDSKQEETQH